MHSLKRWSLSVLLPVCMATTAAVAANDNYPNQPITVIVSYAAGGTADIATRIVANAISKELNTPIVVENRPGGGGSVGLKAALRAKPDGYTIISSSSEVSLAATGKTPAPKDVLEQLEPIAQAATAPIVLVAQSNREESLRDWQQLSRNAEQQVTYATPGVMTPMHLIMAKVAKQADMSLVHIPYNGGARAIGDLLGGQVDMVAVALGTTMGQIKSKQVTPLAVLHSERSSLLKEVPTVAEALQMPLGDIPMTWFGWLVPKEVPNEAKVRLAQALKVVMTLPEVHEQMLAAGLEPHYLDAASFKKVLKSEAVYYQDAAALAETAD